MDIKKGSECNPSLAEIIQDISYTITSTFLTTGAYKIFENCNGKGMYKVIQQQQLIQLPTRPGQPPTSKKP